jgi:hypothetical protein
VCCDSDDGSGELETDAFEEALEQLYEKRWVHLHNGTFSLLSPALFRHTAPSAAGLSFSLLAEPLI